MNRVKLINALTACTKIKKSNQQELLNCVAISDKAVEFTNLRESIKVEIDIGCGEFCVELGALLNSLKAVRANDVYLTHEGSTLEISHTDGTFKLATHDRDEYPFLDWHESFEAMFDLNLEHLKQVRHAQAVDSMREALCGVYVLDDGAVATDGRRLAIAGTAKGKEGLTIPTDAVNAIVGVLDGDVAGLKNKGSIILRGTANDLPVVLTSTLITSEYPNYKNVIPSYSETSATINASDLKYALSATSPAVDNDISAIDLIVEKDSFKVHAEAVGRASDAHFKCESNQDLNIRLNARYLKNAIANCGDSIKLSYDGINDPVVVKGDDYLEVVMPMRTLN